MPLRREGVSRKKAWWYGQLSAAVDPGAAVVGAFAVMAMRPILPYAFGVRSRGDYVVVEEVIPETQRDKYTDMASLGSSVASSS